METPFPRNRPGWPKGSNLHFILTYKFSQDHLELFFGSVRRRGGLNNNPTATQFAGIYKRLLLHGELSSNTGNCSLLDTTSIATVLDQGAEQQINTIPSESCQDDCIFDEYDIFVDQELDKYQRDVACYIGGYVERKVKRSTNCDECLSILKNDEYFGDTTLINLKDYGRLTYPSIDTQEVCKLAGTVFGQFNTTKSLNTRNIRTILVNNTKRLFKREYYLVQHAGEETEAEVHQAELI